MSTAWKGFVTVFSSLLAPLVDGRVGNAQLAGYVRDRLSAGLDEPHCLPFELLRVGLLDFCHDPCPPFGIVYPKILLFHQSGGSSDQRWFDNVEGENWTMLNCRMEDGGIVNTQIALQPDYLDTLLHHL